MRRWDLVVVAVVCLCVGSPRVDAKTNPDTAAITAAIEDQFTGFRESARTSTLYAKNAMLSMTGGVSTPQVNRASDAEGKWTIFGPATIGKHKVRDLRIVIARDGNSAWASFIAKVSVDGLSKTGAVDYRVTELFTRSSNGWQIQAAAWSVGVANAALAKAAKAEKLGTLETVFDQNLGDRDVIGAALSIAKSGLDASATARGDTVAIDTAPGPLLVGGKKVAAKAKKEWVDKLAVEGSTWAVTTGTTACATVNVKLTRGGATLPARLFAVFEKDSGGAWSPVVVHLAAAPPT
jgi:ketosteroid isomerase-like protein